MLRPLLRLARALWKPPTPREPGAASLHHRRAARGTAGCPGRAEMSDAVGTIEQLAGELARVFAPLARPVEGNAVHTWLEWLGLRPSDAVAGASDLAAALDATVTSAADVEEFSEKLADAIRQDAAAAVATASA